MTAPTRVSSRDRIQIRWLSDEVGPFAPQHQVALITVELSTGTRIDALGASQYRPQARKIARMEMTERLAMFTTRRKSMRLGRAGTHSIDPRLICELAPQQAAQTYLSPYDPEKEYYWVAGHDVLSHKIVEIIADLCAIYPPNDDDPQRIAWVNSSGMAAHSEHRLAERAALLELFERDALMVTWMARACPPHIPRSCWSETVLQTITGIESIGYHVHTLDITCRGVPVVMAIAETDKRPALIVGMAADESLEQALERASRELETGLVFRLVDGGTDYRAGEELEPGDVKTVGDHAAFYAEPSNRRHASFLWSSKQASQREPRTRVDVLSPNNFEVERCCQELAIDRLHKVDYSNPHSLAVVRLLTPNLVPLAFGYDQFPIGHPARQSVVFPYDVPDKCCQDVRMPHPFD